MNYHKSDRVSEQERFWSKVSIEHEDLCWNWLATKDGRGYGMFSIRRREGRKSRMMRSHRYSLELKEGRHLLPDEEACHTCDNTSCCNPNHLFVGTHDDNMKDMVSKGRNNYTRKVSDNQIQELIDLRSQGALIKDIAIQYGISESQASRLSRGMTA